MEFTARTSDGLELQGQYWPVATGETKAVMPLVHGFGEHCGRYADMAAHLNASGIAVVAIDLRGHGKSPGPRGVIHDYDDFRADLATLLEQTRDLYPTQPMILFGHSMGGGIVLDYGLNKAADVRAIIASAPMINPPKVPSKFLRFIVKAMYKLKPNGTLSQPIEGDKISTLTVEQQRYIDDPLNHGKLGFGLARHMIETGEAIAAKANDWSAPLLLFHSRDDQLTSFASSKTFATKAQNVTFRPMENVAHEMHNDTSRDEVYRLITDFVLSHASEKTT